MAHCHGAMTFYDFNFLLGLTFRELWNCSHVPVTFENMFFFAKLECILYIFWVMKRSICYTFRLCQLI